MLTLLSILTGPALALDLCEPPALGAGSLFAVQVTDAPPGARVWFVRGDQIGGPTCPAALNGSCVDVTSPRVIGSAIARADGSVELRGAVPAGVPAGARVAVQAVVLIAGQPAVVSDAFERALDDPAPVCGDNTCALDDRDRDGVDAVCDVCPTGNDRADYDRDGTPDACDQPPLLAWYDFDDPAAPGVDSSGRRHTLTLFGGSSVPSPVSGTAWWAPAGRSWATSDPAVDLDVTDALSVSAWVCPEGWDTHNAMIAKADRGGAVQDWGFYLNNGELMVDLDYPAGQTTFTTTGVGLSLHRWVHVAMTWDGATGELTFWRDGAQVGASTWAGPMPAHALGLLVGSNAGTPHDFIGRMDQIGVWAGVLQPSEIAALATP